MEHNQKSRVYWRLQQYKLTHFHSARVCDIDSCGHCMYLVLLVCLFSLRITCTYNRYCVMFISCPVYFITCNYIQKLYYVVITIIHAGTSPVSVTDLSQGLHHFKVLPQGCDRGSFTGLPFRFTIQ